MAKISAINNKSEELTIDPGASGDSFVQFDINGTGEFRIGVDDDDSDKFKISQGSALGSNDTFVVTAAGEITKPLTPAFLAYNSTTDSNVTGDGTNFTVDYDTEIFDQNGDFASDTFTAPVTGRYKFITCVKVTGLASSGAGSLRFITSNRTFQGQYMDWYALSASGVFSRELICIADMDASDTVYVELDIGGGSKVVDVAGGASPIETCFSGYLIC